MKCQVSAFYSKDENKNLLFYCNFCGREMDYNEDKECIAIPKKCSCGNPLGDIDYSVGICLECKQTI